MTTTHAPHPATSHHPRTAPGRGLAILAVVLLVIVALVGGMIAMFAYPSLFWQVLALVAAFGMIALAAGLAIREP
ncbi:MAG: hypothetical protein Q4G64_06635 [bacterium]|nr:hypothetical protein [bacterium]